MEKNRPEDTKTAQELMMTDRGGLYLDSKPGVYKDVIRTRFCQFVPKYHAAARNISPETLNCACCQPAHEEKTSTHFLPLNRQLAQARS